MILYLDSSSIVKQYVVEPGSKEVRAAAESAEIMGTSLLSRAEVGAAFKKACRTKAVDEHSAGDALRRFGRDWPSLVRIRVTEKLMQHASSLAWTYDLRGYDSVHLASAAAWRQALERDLTVATYDVAMWMAAGEIGLAVFPPDLPGWLAGRHKI